MSSTPKPIQGPLKSVPVSESTTFPVEFPNSESAGQTLMPQPTTSNPIPTSLSQKSMSTKNKNWFEVAPSALGAANATPQVRQGIMNVMSSLVKFWRSEVMGSVRGGGGHR